MRQAVFFTGQRALGIDVELGPAAVELRQGRERHRQHRHADRPRQPRVPVVRLRHRRGAARDDARQRRRLGARGLLHARDAQSPRQLGADRRLPLRLLRRHPDRDALRHRQGGLARPQRRQGLDGVRRRPALSLQRERRRRPRRGEPRPATASTAASRSAPAACRRGATRSCPAASCSSGTRTTFMRTMSGRSSRGPTVGHEPHEPANVHNAWLWPDRPGRKARNVWQTHD